MSAVSGRVLHLLLPLHGLVLLVPQVVVLLLLLWAAPLLALPPAAAAAAAAAAWAPSTLLAPAAPLLLLLAILPAPALLSIASLLPLLLLLLPGYDVVKREAQALRLRHFGCAGWLLKRWGWLLGPMVKFQAQSQPGSLSPAAQATQPRSVLWR